MVNQLPIRIEHHTTISQYDLQIETLFWNLGESYRTTQFSTITKTIPRFFSTHKNPGGSHAEQNKFSVNAGKT